MAANSQRQQTQPYIFDPESDPEPEEEEEPPAQPRLQQAVSEWLVNFFNRLICCSTSPSLFSCQLTVRCSL